MEKKNNDIMDSDVKIAYICICHIDPDFVAHTANSLQYKNDGFFIHVDKKVDITPFLEKCKQITNVHFVDEENRVENYWGGFNSIVATFNTIELALSTDSYDRFVLLQGQDYPLFSTKHIHDFFIRNHDTEFCKAKIISTSKSKCDYIKVGCYWHMDKINLIWRAIHRFNTLGFKYRKLFFRMGCEKWSVFHGWAQWALTKKCIEYVRQVYLNSPAFNQFMKHRFAPDELYFHTVIYNSEYKHKLSDRIVFNRDHVETLLNLTYFEYPVLVTVFRQSSDYDWLQNTGALFVRKVNSSSEELIRRIDSEIMKSDRERNDCLNTFMGE